MTQEPNAALVEKLAAKLSDSDPQEYYSEGEDYLIMARAILPIITRENEAAYQRGLRDAAAICDEVVEEYARGHDFGNGEYAKRIRERLP